MLLSTSRWPCFLVSCSIVKMYCLPMPTQLLVGRLKTEPLVLYHIPKLGLPIRCDGLPSGRATGGRERAGAEAHRTNVKMEGATKRQAKNRSRRKSCRSRRYTGDGRLLGK